MAARDANRGRGGGGRAGPGNRSGAGGGRQGNAGTSASASRGGSGGSVTGRGIGASGGRAPGGRAAVSPQPSRATGGVGAAGSGGRTGGSGSSAARGGTASGGSRAASGGQTNAGGSGIAGGDVASGGMATTGRAPGAPTGAAGAWQTAGRGPNEPARETAAPTANASRSSERQRDIESAQEDRPTGSRMATSTARDSQEGGRVMGRGQPSAGLSAWLAGADNPFAMMRRMEEDLDRVFRAFGMPRFGPSFAAPRELEQLLVPTAAFAQAARWAPQIEVLERDGSLVVRADLPGVRREDVEVNVDNDVLTIRGERRQEHREAEGGYRRTERSYGSFLRQIPLPEGVDPERVEATYQDGVLEVVLPSPRQEQQRRRRIEIR